MRTPVRLTTGEGEASNPLWHPDGQHIAFAWTRGFAPGNWNVFIMDVASRETVQLTHGAGRNENPTWAPDGRHLVFASNRNGSMQIYTMLADGTEVRQLTSQGINTMPVWGEVDEKPLLSCPSVSRNHGGPSHSQCLNVNPSSPSPSSSCSSRAAARRRPPLPLLAAQLRPAKTGPVRQPR